jgi:hypothetical protein
LTSSRKELIVPKGAAQDGAAGKMKRTNNEQKCKRRC